MTALGCAASPGRAERLGKQRCKWPEASGAQRQGCGVCGQFYRPGLRIMLS